jgi:hypothetical protein
MTASSSRLDQPNSLATRSLQSVTATAVFAAITHAYDFGPTALMVGAIAIVILAGLNFGIRRSGSRILLVPYAVLNAFAIIGFGIVGGFWNHGVKLIVNAAHGGSIPTALEPFFMTTDVGDLVFESCGTLMFVASMFAAYFGYRLVRAARTQSSARRNLEAVEP